jgi:hypothetical protein
MNRFDSEDLLFIQTRYVGAPAGDQSSIQVIKPQNSHALRKRPAMQMMLNAYRMNTKIMPATYFRIVHS